MPQAGKQPPARSLRRPLLIALLVALSVAFWPIRQWIGYRQASQAMTRAFELANAGDLSSAEKSAWQAWSLSKKIPEGAVLAARLALSQREFSRSLEYLEPIQESLSTLRPELAVETLTVQGQAFEGVLNLSAAVDSYVSALELDRGNVTALTNLSKIYGTCGRRDEAIPYILKLIELGQETDLLMLLARDSGAIRNEQLLRASHEKYPDDPLPVVGMASLALESDDPGRAKELLEKAIRLDPNYLPAVALSLRVLAESEKWNELASQLAGFPESKTRALDSYVTVWIARGRLAESQQNVEGAIRCYAEASRRNPESRHPTSRLAVLLAQHGESKLAEEFAEYARKTQLLRAAQDRIIFAAAPESPQAMLELIGYYERCNRFWEAHGWALWAARKARNSLSFQAVLEKTSRKTLNAPMSVVDFRNHPVGSVSLERYSLPDFSRSKVVDAPTISNFQTNPSELKFTFEDQALETNFEFQFYYGTEGEPKRFMYELSGGGVGILDFDMDGWEDIVTPQGKRWPPSSDLSMDRKDMIFRNLEGKRFKGNTLALQEDGFGQGVACGDCNNDGFCDIYIAQIGSNRLLQNMGDGTFLDITDDSGLHSEQWTVSCVIADLNGDTYPDLYDVNYLKGDDLFTRICSRNGLPAQCSPFDFSGAPDACWFNDGQGHFSQYTGDLPIGRGLGAVAADLNGSGKLSLFIANDTDPNFLINFEQQADAIVLSESGITSGVAFNSEGKAEGSMGIALGDVNTDGRMDLFVTNFLNESNTYYRNQGDGLFSDSTKLSGLDLPSIDVLGFGTQFFDANLDGKLELFIANGHVDDLRALNRPYKMPPHFYTSNGERFTRVLDAGEYFKQELLGRSVAKLDWNRDQRADLVVGHLQSAYSLLTNETVSMNRAVSIRLVGTRSSRDAVGATVVLVDRDQKQYQQVTAGDGYESSNSKTLIFGVKDLSLAHFEISWPSGTKQAIHGLDSQSEFVVIEP
jgi:tetratricopeptide (TPR) repeat protein